MIGVLYHAYSEEDIKAEKQPILKEKIIDYIYNTLYEFNVYREVSIGPQTFKYYFYKGIIEQADYYFSALPYNNAIKLITEDIEILKEKYGR